MKASRLRNIQDCKATYTPQGLDNIPTQFYYYLTMQENSKSNMSIWWIAGVAAVILLALLFVFNNKSNNSSTSMMSSSMSSAANVQVGGQAMYADQDIISNVSRASNLTTLVAAVKAAGLVETLQGPGPFTVFGPDNNAFANLPAGTVDTLLKPENKAMLTSILTYHVVSGKYNISDLSDGMMLKTVQGGQLLITKKNGKTMINNATVLTGDVNQKNGVAHVINTVLTPVPMVGGAAMYPNRDIVSNVSNAENLTTLVTAVKAAGLVETLQSSGPFTVFGPDNNAFAKLPAGTVESLIKPENKATLTKILTYHVVSGKYTSDMLTDGLVLKTVQGENLTVKRNGTSIMLVDAKGGTSTVSQADIAQSNGVAHVIDTVLMPN